MHTYFVDHIQSSYGLTVQGRVLMQLLHTRTTHLHFACTVMRSPRHTCGGSYRACQGGVSAQWVGVIRLRCVWKVMSSPSVGLPFVRSLHGGNYSTRTVWSIESFRFIFNPGIRRIWTYYSIYGKVPEPLIPNFMGHPISGRTFPSSQSPSKGKEEADLETTAD